MYTYTLSHSLTVPSECKDDDQHKSHDIGESDPESVDSELEQKKQEKVQKKEQLQGREKVLTRAKAALFEQEKSHLVQNQSTETKGRTCIFLCSGLFLDYFVNII